MKKILIVAAAFVLCATTALAAEGDRKVKMDKNDDGKVSQTERKQANHRYLENRNEVDKNWEKKADHNDDGVVGKHELKKSRTHRYLKNNNEVDTKWEKHADKNNDGTVGKKELNKSRKARKDKKK